MTVEVQHLNVKFFVEDPASLDLEVFLSIFNGWIQTHATEELLIDVADYRHVWAGPGVVLIGHEANYSMDNGGNRLGLLYDRKAALNGDVQDRMHRVVGAALLACDRLEEDPLLKGRIKFRGDEVEMTINDRLLAPNTEETFQALKPELAAFLNRLYAGAAYGMERKGEPRERFSVHVKTVPPFEVATLLKNLESAQS